MDEIRNESKSFFENNVHSLKLKFFFQQTEARVPVISVSYWYSQVPLQRGRIHRDIT